MTLLETGQTSLIWYLIWSAFGVATYPLLFAACRSLPDRGISLIRPAGMAIAVLPLWVAGYLTDVPFTGTIIVGLVLLIGIPGWTVALRRLEVATFVSRQWRTVVSFEVATLSLFAGYVLFRGFNPDIVNTEKPMELAFLNASINGGELPVEDPWFAGESINYYYFGYVALAAVAMVSSVPGEIAFNLGLATVFASAIVAAGGLAANLTGMFREFQGWRAVSAGIIAGLFTGFAGNLHAFREFVSSPSETLNAGWWDGVGWGSSRIVEDSGFPDGSSRTVITEFPAFSWILGDLHPHVLAYPWLILTLSLVVNLYAAIMTRESTVWLAVVAATAGVSTGVLYSSNTWDVPVMLAMLALVVLLARRHLDRKMLLVISGSAFGSFLLTAGPFMLAYDSPAGPGARSTENGTSFVPGVDAMLGIVGYVDWDRSSFGELLTHWGAFIVILIPVIMIIARGNREQLRSHVGWLAGGSSILIITSLLFQAPAVALFGGPAAALLYLAFATAQQPSHHLLSGMIGTALLLLCAIEFFFVRDPFGDRMNTVFKISFQVWAVMGIAIGALIPTVIDQIRTTSQHRWFTAATATAVGLVFVAVSVYSPVSGYRWSNNFAQWRGIDGLGYIERTHPDERLVIDWISETDEPVGVIMEAPGCAYGTEQFLPHNRVSMATGIPTVIGWDGHQSQWRRGQPDRLAEIGVRIESVRDAYEDPGRTQDLVTSLGVTHVYVGRHERIGYQRCPHGPPYDIPDRAELQDHGWELVFEQGTIDVYRLPDSAQPN